MDGQDLLDRLPNGRIIVKDLSIDKSLVPGNPFSRFDTSDQSRKYCSKDLWDNLGDDERYIIPDDSKIPRPLVMCASCGNESYTMNTEERPEPVCGRCKSPIFECPAPDCDAEVHGEPDECPECGANYKW